MPEEWESNDATQFDPEDAPPEQQEQYQTLWDTNRGYARGGYADTANPAAEDRRGRYESIASSLELTDAQRERAFEKLEDLDLRKLGLSLDLVIFCLCALVVREDGREYHPSRNSENNDNIFIEQAEELGLRQGAIASCWEKLRQHFSS